MSNIIKINKIIILGKQNSWDTISGLQIADHGPDSYELCIA